MAGGSGETVDLKKLQEYINAANRLGARLKEMRQQKIKIDPPPGWIEHPTWYHEMSKIFHIHMAPDGTFFIPLDRAKNWGYLAHPGSDSCWLKVMGELWLTDFLALYRAYEEGLLREIIAKLERTLPEVKKTESLLRKIDEILAKIGIRSSV